MKMQYTIRKDTLCNLNINFLASQEGAARSQARRPAQERARQLWAAGHTARSLQGQDADMA